MARVLVLPGARQARAFCQAAADNQGAIEAPTEMSHVNLYMQGRWGNMCLQYLAARGYCERHGFTLHTQPWVGEKIFQLQNVRIEHDYPKRNEEGLAGNEHSISLSGYFQNQLSADQYTRTQARRWFNWRPEIRERLEQMPKAAPVVIHRRIGDYIGYGYPVPSESSIRCLCRENNWHDYEFITEETPHHCEGFVGDLAFVPDFWLLTQAKILVRANSTFSFVASLLCDGQIFAPVIDGLTGGFQDVCYVEGNWPRLSHHDFVSDMHVKP